MSSVSCLEECKIGADTIGNLGSDIYMAVKVFLQGHLSSILGDHELLCTFPLWLVGARKKISRVHILCTAHGLLSDGATACSMTLISNCREDIRKAMLSQDEGESAD